MQQPPCWKKKCWAIQVSIPESKDRSLFCSCAWLFSKWFWCVVACTHTTLEYENSLSFCMVLVKSLRTSSATWDSENILLLQHFTGTCQAGAQMDAEITAGSYERENSGWGWGNNPRLQDKFACGIIPWKHWKPQTGPNMRKWTVGSNSALMGVNFIGFPCPSCADKWYGREEEDSRFKSLWMMWVLPWPYFFKSTHS